MKYCISFGVQGGAHVDRMVVPTQKLSPLIPGPRVSPK